MSDWDDAAVPELPWDKDLKKSDQDYISMVGHDPRKSMEEIAADCKKRNPRAFAREPEMLFSRPVSEWLETAIGTEPGEQFFGPFWRKEELSILFAGTGLGKSALATQIGESLARGLAIPPFTNKIEPQRVLYLDFELNTSQLAMRYSLFDDKDTSFSVPYSFAPEFIRSEMYWNGHVIDGYDGFSDMFFENIGNEIERHEATVLIVDNITFLDLTSTSNANTALSIMRSLSRLKRERFISVLVLAHTPKRRRWKPLTESDLQGSINLANFADSMFAIGHSRKGSDLRYVKQTKVRSGRPELDTHCVPVYRLAKFDNAASLGLTQNTEKPPIENFLGFEFVEFAPEENHLDLPPRGGPPSRPDPKLRRKSVIEYARRLAAEGKSARKISVELGVSRATANRYAKQI